MTPQENSQMLDCRPFWDSDEYIIVPKGLFNHNLSNAIVNASVLRDCENDLYALYAWIIVLNCATIRPPEYPLGSALPIPQPFFGRKGVVLGDPAVKGQPDEVREASGARGHEQDPKQETRTPDFARILVTVSGGDSVDEDVVRRLVDFWEIKRLNIEDPWWTQAGRMAAGVELKRHLGQVYDSAMAAFESNPEWTEVSALLVVGIWFTQFRWERPPSLISSRDSSTHNGEDLEGMISALAIASSLDDDSLHAGATSSRAPGASTSTLLPPEEPPAPTSPATPLLNADRFFTQIARQLESTLPEIKDHSIPTIVYYNQCVVDHSYDDRLGMRYSLSDDFLDAIANSLDGYDADLQPSWFVRKNKERERAISDEEIVAEITDCLEQYIKGGIDEGIMAMQGNLRRPGQQDDHTPDRPTTKGGLTSQTTPQTPEGSPYKPNLSDSSGRAPPTRIQHAPQSPTPQVLPAGTELRGNRIMPIREKHEALPRSAPIGLAAGALKKVTRSAPSLGITTVRGGKTKRRGL